MEIRSKIFLCAFIPGCAIASTSIAEPVDVSINNELSNCIEIVQSNVSQEKEIPILNIQFKKKQSISECGCKSMLSTYSAGIKFDGHESFSISGNFVFPKTNELKLPVATSQSMVGGNSVNIRFSCAASD